MKAILIKNIVPIIICVTHFPTLIAQSLHSDSSFFADQAVYYQKWLEYEGFAPFIQVHGIQVEDDQVSLFLESPYQGLDSTISAWQTLKETYEAQHAFGFESRLFYTFLHTMELDTTQGNIQFHNTYNPFKRPLFSRGIYYKHNKVEVAENNPRSTRRKVNIDVGEFKSIANYSVNMASHLSTKRMVYQYITAYAHELFEINRGCFDGCSEVINSGNPCDTSRIPELFILEIGEVLRFEVNDLCRVVLTDEANPMLCKVLQTLLYPCDWIKRERLIFLMEFSQLPEGGKLSIEIDGKYGSGYYEEVKRGGYIDMDIDFGDYLEIFADKFSYGLQHEFSAIE